MAEELRFFLRTAAYTVVIGAVYWFVSYEVAGSVMLVFVSLATAIVVAVPFVAVRATHAELDPGSGPAARRVLGALLRLIGFTDPRQPAHEEPLAAGLQPIPVGSIWPVIAAASALLIGLGLVYGPWLTLPGVALLAVTAWGWLTQMDARR